MSWHPPNFPLSTACRFGAVALTIVALGVGCSLHEQANAQEIHSVHPSALSRTCEQPAFTQAGTASWYGRQNQGRTTASGEPFDASRLTAAHRSLAFGTVLRVSDLTTGRTVKVRVNDRGPYVRGRILDLSAEAAKVLGIRQEGVARVRIEVLASDQNAQRSGSECRRRSGSRVVIR